MKYLYRKPLLPVLLMIMFLFGTCFITLFQKGMAEDEQRIEDIYNNTRIYIEALPLEESAQSLRMVVYRGNAAAELPEIADNMVVQTCCYSSESNSNEEISSFIYGTNNPDTYAQYLDFQIEWGKGWNRDSFLDTETEIGCLMDKELAETLNLTVGDTFDILPFAYMNQEVKDAPTLTFTVAGVFAIRQSGLEKNALIVPNTIFKGDGGLLYNSTMVNNCFYQVYRLELNPAYNREVDVVLEKIEKKLIDKYSLVTNVRTMRQLIRPIELKLQLQEMLELPLRVVFVVATMVLGLLLALSLKTELFLRFLIGERRYLVLLRVFGSLFLMLCFFAGLSLLAVRLVAGAIWVAQAFCYLKVTGGLTALVMALPLAVIAGRNLVKLYQQREG